MKNKLFIKNKKVLMGISSGVLAISIAIGSTIGISSLRNKDDEIKNGTNSEQVVKNPNTTLDFETIEFGNKTYLTLAEEDLVVLIEQAMKEVDNEYIDNGNKTIFNVNDNRYSQFKPEDILAILYTESSFRLIEVKSKSKGIFNVDNYARFYGKDKEGVIYYGPGMMNRDAINYIVTMDRLSVNHFKNHEYIEVNGKQVKITYENINPYDYVIQSGAQSEQEVKQALKECIILNSKCIYITLNRFVKDNVKVGTHDNELDVLDSYVQFKNLTLQEKQKAYALIAYNNGPTKTRKHMLDGTLFDKYKEGENKGKYIVNVAYASKVLKASGEYQENNYNKNYLW